MDNNGQRHDDNLVEQRIYQVLALLERAGEQQRMAAETLARASALEQRIDQGIQIASGAAAKRIAEEVRSALDGAIADSAKACARLRAARWPRPKNLRQPWWIHLVMIVMTGILSASLAFWTTHTADIADYQQDQRNQQLIREGQMLERVWPKLTPAQRKKIEQLNNE